MRVVPRFLFSSLQALQFFLDWICGFVVGSSVFWLIRALFEEPNVVNAMARSLLPVVPAIISASYMYPSRWIAPRLFRFRRLIEKRDRLRRQREQESSHYVIDRPRLEGEPWWKKYH